MLLMSVYEPECPHAANELGSRPQLSLPHRTVPSQARRNLGYVLPVATSPEAELERVNDRGRRYEIGQFFTPGPIATLMADAVREVAPATVLDPGVGGGTCFGPLVKARSALG